MSDSEFSAPLSLVTSRESLSDNDASITTAGSIDDGRDSRRESLDNDCEKQHPKGKRKRTAAKDKAILEEAYRNNPKPDKWARLEIVDRVSLNEKEVQIWFQNRRQNDRRKSRPLSPQEIDALRSGSMQILSNDPYYASYGSTPAPMATGPYLAPFGGHHSSPSESHAFREDGRRALNPFPTLNSPSFARRSPSNPRYLYGRSISPTSTAAPVLAPSLINAHVHVRPQARISLSFDGKAEMMAEREPTPSRLPHPARSLSAAGLPGFPLSHHARAAHSALQRSNSALSLPNITLPPISTLTDSLPSSAVPSATPSPAFMPPSRLGFGASSPDDESDGSAHGAISLMRSMSGSVPAKRHILPNKQPWSTVAQPVLDTTFEQRPIDRCSPVASRPHSISSLLSPDEASTEVLSEKPKEEVSRMDVSMLLAPSKEGNKENRSPERFACQPVQPQPYRPRVLPRMLHNEDGSVSPPPSRRGSLLPSASQCGLLGKRRPSDGSRLAYGDGSDATNDGRRVRRRSDEEIEEEDLVQSISKKSDLDCITGLLRLRDGNWR